MSNSNSPKFLGLSGGALVHAQTFLVCLPSFVSFGYNQSGLGGFLSLDSFLEYFPTLNKALQPTASGKSHASTLQGAVVSAFSLGALLGALFCTFFGDKLGRKKAILLGGVLVLVGQVLELSSTRIEQLSIGRTILGWGIGILNVTVPVWQSECSKPKNRGRHVALDGCFISLGYLLTTWLSYGFFVGTTGQISWRVPIAIGCVFTFPLLASTFFLPESPRWLIMKERVDEARIVIASFNETDPDSETVSEEVATIQTAHYQSVQNNAKWTDIFKMGEKKLLMRFLMCMALQCLQQMSGGNLISVYSTTLYQENLGMGGDLSRILSAATLTFKFCCGFISFFTVDRFGRRILLMVSGTGMASCMMFLAITTSMPNNHHANIASVFFIFAFNFFIPIGFLGVNWLYVTEIAPTDLRTYISSIASANNWIWNFVVTMITPVAINNLGYKYYIIYTLIGFVIPVMVYFFFPETMGLELEAIDILFIKSPSPMTVVATAKRERPYLLSDEYKNSHQLREDLLFKADSETKEAGDDDSDREVV